MANPTFLNKLSKELITEFAGKLTDVVIVLPNKRARIFLLEALKKNLDQTVFAPTIVSIEDFMQDVAGIRSVDAMTTLFEFYNVYSKLTPPEKLQPFEQFANWAKTLLQDFNEIDRYLLNPNFVLSYLKDIEDIKHWAVDASQQTPMIKNYLEFWGPLPQYYKSLYAHLLKKGIGYQGIIYREAANNINIYTNTLKKHKIIFAGFNALNTAEETILRHLVSAGRAEIYWDIDQVFLEDKYHDAGLFIRRYQREWKEYGSKSFQWIVKDYSEPKNINIIGTPKTIGQAKIAGEIIEQILESGAGIDKTAIVLGEENMLIPLLYSLPASVGSLNITMGYSSRNNPAQILVHKLLKMHTNAIARNEKNYTFYYKEVLDILTHPLVEPYAGAAATVNVINRNNLTFFSQSKLFGIQGEISPLFRLLFVRWDDGVPAVLNRLSEILLLIKSFLSNDQEEEKIVKAFLYSIFKVVNTLINYSEEYRAINSLQVLYQVYKQAAELAEVSFEGEPLTGLQVMGVLESRVLDFENVIITSMNEGKFPAGKSTNSFIPYDVKRELGLPTYKEKDAIYSYHFYHLLLRAKNIYLLYNTESEGLDAGERSRFLTQIEIEKQPAHNIVNTIYNAYLPDKAYEPMAIHKSAPAMQRLYEIATISGFSASALTGYIGNPLKFYYQRVLRIREAEEVEENIALNTLGTIIHGTLEALYKPYLSKLLTVQDVDDMVQLANDEVMRQFIMVYKEGEIKKGKNLLAFEVAKRNVYNLLMYEKQLLIDGDQVEILALEQKFDRKLEDGRLPFPVLISGNIDRIEHRNGKIRIIDYKTGKVEKNNLVLKDWETLTSDIKNEKIIQLLTYAFMHQNYAQSRETEVGIISFKNMKNGFMGFSYKDGWDRNAPALHIVDDRILEAFKTQLVLLINEILNPDIPFEEKLA
ncbi:hypothetical protein CHU92_09605 [Flavobacterium cyanobacteriorum]|uniref:PD-(D/E)XK endonuclease-like domain-containing protein n=1 Tax=Flavobacterium cyanobacteriorum TaxID=2022802 RepID=A0A255Z7N1_9FLAO|nr:PD-(D/E)XK nuclease family protein [Flavobacterium cyanobacteriorum]OYQ36640.1 hypothetical protein CHU92_09605 [Flavobacterium cyanobacteriorum]